MSTSFIEETSHTRIDLHNRLLDTQNELQGKIQQLKNYGKDSSDRRHRDGYYSGKLNQLNDLWQQFCDLEVMKKSSKRHYPLEVSTLHD